MSELVPQAAELTRLPTGIAGLDSILHGGFFHTASREFQIMSQGIEVATTFESANAILTGIAQTTDAQAVRTRWKS